MQESRPNDVTDGMHPDPFERRPHSRSGRTPWPCESKTTPSSATANRRLWSAPTARSTGCAGRVSILPRVSPRCSEPPRMAGGSLLRRLLRLRVKRSYRPGTLVLETEFQTETGCAAILDFMPPADGADSRAHRRGPIRTHGLSHRVHRAIRLRSDNPLGQASLRRGDQRCRRPRASGLAKPSHSQRRRSQDGRRLHGRGGPIRRRSSYPTAPPIRIRRARSTPSNRWSARKPFGGDGATDVPMSAPGPKP